MREAIQRVIEHPGSASVEYTPKGEEGRYYGDFFLWRRDPDFEEFMRHSPLPAIAAKVLKSIVSVFFMTSCWSKNLSPRKKLLSTRIFPTGLSREKTSSPSGSLLIVSDFNREEYVFSRDPIDGNSVMLPQPLVKTVVLKKFTQKWVGNHFRILKKMTPPITG